MCEGSFWVWLPRSLLVSSLSYPRSQTETLSKQEVMGVMRSKFRATIKGQQFLFVVEPPGPQEYAVVDYELRRVSISPEAQNKDWAFRAELLIHEALHILAPEWTEKRVLQAGRDIIRLLITSKETR